MKIPARCLLVTCCLVLSVVLTPLASRAGTVTSYKGYGTLSGQRFSSPQGITLDANGVIMVSDTGNDAVKGFNENGQPIFNFTSSGTGAGQLDGPQGTTRDGQGNLWVVDTNNNRLEEFDKDGNFVQSVGSYGNASQHQLGNPYDIKVGPDGNYWIADYGKHRIVVLDKAGRQVRVIGKTVNGSNQGSEDGQFSGPTGLDFDGDGNLWVVDFYNHRLQKFDQEGNFLAKSGVQGTAQTLSSANGVCPTADGVLISSGNQVIKYNLNGLPVLILGKGDNSAGSGNGEFDNPQGIAVDSSGNIFVADHDNHRIQQFSAGGTFVSVFGGYAGGASANYYDFDPGDIYNPIDIAVDASGSLWILSEGYYNGQVQNFTTTGTYVSGFDGGSDAAGGKLSGPHSLAIDGSGAIWISESSADRVRQFKADGAHLQTIASVTINGQAADLSYPLGLEVSGNTLWVGHYYNAKILSINLTDKSAQAFPNYRAYGLAKDSAGAIWAADYYSSPRLVQLAGNGELKRAFSETEAASELLYYPVAVDSDGNGGLWVTDEQNGRLLHYDKGGTLTQKIGGHASGLLNQPYQATVAADGSLWVAEYSGKAARHFSAAGEHLGKIDNTTQAAVTLGGPTGIALYQDQAVPPNEYVIVTDYNNHQVLKFTSAGAFAGFLGEAGAGSGMNQYYYPARVTVDGQELLVADNSNGRIKALTPDGAYKRAYATDGADFSQLYSPSSVVYNPATDTLWVADSNNARIQIVAPIDGSFVRSIGGPKSGLFGEPSRLYADATGHVWASDSSLGRVVELDGDGNLVKSLGETKNGGSLSYPCAVLGLADGSFWVADTGHHTIGHFASTGLLQTIAGGYGNGAGQLSSPQGLAVSSDGSSIYVADTDNDRIAVFSKDGAFVKHISQSGSPKGYLARPAGLALDSQGRLWVAEKNNNRLQVFAANGTAQFTVSSPMFNSPFGVALDPQGKVWVTDTNNHRVLKLDITAEGAATTLLTLGKSDKTSGSGPGEFYNPTGIAIDSEGHVQVADGNNRIQVFSADGAFLRAYGGVSQPRGISISNGKVLVADSSNSRVAVFLENGAPVASFSDSGAAEDGFNQPQGLAKDSAGNLWVADYGNNRVVRVDDSGKVTQKVNLLLSGPVGMAIDQADNLWVTSQNNNLVLKYAKNGALLKAFDNGGAAFDTIDSPSGMAFYQNNLFVIDRNNHRVVALDANGATIRAFGAYGNGPGLLYDPSGITVGPDKNLWITQAGADTISVFTPEGNFVKTFGSPGNMAGMMQDPAGLAFTAEGGLWVVNKNLHRLDLFSQTGTYQKSIGSYGSAPGELNYPQDLAIDSQDRLFVSDYYNHRISVFDNTGAFLYSFGGVSPVGVAIDQNDLLWVLDGGGSLFAFTLDGVQVFKGGEYGDKPGMMQNPSGLAIDANGALWVADSSLNTLQSFTINQPQNLDIQLVHRHWRYGAEAQHIVDVPVGAVIAPKVTGSIALGDSSGSGDIKEILPTVWNSTNTAVATVDAKGTVTTKAAGQTEVQATVNGQTLTMTVKVVADQALPVMVLGNNGAGAGEYSYPGPLWAGKDKLYVADDNNQRIVVLDLAGNWVQTLPAPGYSIAGLAGTADGKLFVSDANTNLIHTLDANGALLLSMGGSGSEAGQLSGPQGLAFDSAGNIWVADTYNNRVQKFSPSGQYLSGFGSYGWNDPQLASPAAVAVDATGSVLVADNYYLKKFSADGVFVAKTAEAGYPRTLWLDQSGAIWTRGSDYHIRKYGPDLTLLMDYDAGTYQAEPGKFNNPDGIAVDSLGSLWVAESSNHRLQRIRFIPKQLALVSPKTVIKDQEQINAIATYGVTDTVSPSEAINAQAQWSVNDPAMASVEEGLVSALDTGQAYVTAQYAGLSSTLFLSLLASYAVEEAGNTDVANAQPIDLGKAMEGSFGSNWWEAHWFSISPGSDGFYRIFYSSGQNQYSNTTLAIVDSQGNTIHTINSLPASGLTVPIFLQGQTDYYLQLSGSNQDFMLSYIFVAPGQPTTLEDATAMTLGEPVSGQVAIGSSDYYKLVLNGPQQLLVSYENSGSLSDMQITVYPEEVGVEKVLDQVQSSSGEAKQIAIGLNQGTYYIEVKPYGNIDDSTYTLTVAPNLQIASGEYEGNNTLAFANSMTDGQALTARNYSPQDVDLYTFHYAPASSQDYLTLNFIQNDTNGYHTIRLLNLEGNQLNAYSASYYSTPITNKKINMKPGQYFLEVTDSNNSRTEYQLSLAGKVNKISSIKKVTGLELIPAKDATEIKVGDTVAITAKVYYSDGSVENNPATTVWTGTNPGAMTVTQGQVVVNKAGAGSVVASFEGKVATLDLSVGVAKKQSYGNLIVVAGGGVEAGNKLKDITQYLTDLAYQKFKGRGFGDEDILYFNPLAFKDLDGNGFDDGIVDVTAISKEGFAGAITQWAKDYPSTGPLYIYLNDHGANAQFQLYPNQILTAAAFKEALDAFQAATNRAVVVIIEACHSGTFVDPLMTDASNRVVITSSDDGVSYLGDGGSASFSQFFLGSLYKGSNLSGAFSEANTSLAALGKPYTGMSPQVAPAVLAGSAQDYYVVGNFALAPMFPSITGTTLAATHDASSTAEYSIKATVTGVDNGKVWATIKPSNYMPPSVTGDFTTPDIQLPMIDLLDADQEGAMDGVFNGTYSGFTGNGTYDVVIFARDAEGNITQTAVHKLTVSGLAGENGYLSAGSGWNLLSSAIPFQVSAVFADSQKFMSVWKWENNQWSVYLPGELSPGSYAVSKNFGVLSDIKSGEGFWVNAKTDQAVVINGAPDYGLLAFGQGWNLLGLKSAEEISVTDFTAGQNGIVSLWKWEGGKWSVSLPDEAAPGSYAANKGFGVLSTIKPGEGFWVNKP